MKFQNRAIITKMCQLLSILLLYITILSQVIVTYVLFNSLINVLLAKEQVVIQIAQTVFTRLLNYIKRKILPEKSTVDECVPGMLVFDIMVKKSRQVKMTISKTGLSLQIFILIPKVTSNHNQKTVKLFHFMS